MADSKDNPSASAKFTHDLDEMLNDVEFASDDSDDFIDDEDAIDRLLMDDSFDLDESEKEETPDASTDVQDKNDFDIDDLVDSVTIPKPLPSKPVPEIDEFAEIADFGPDDVTQVIDPKDLQQKEQEANISAPPPKEPVHSAADDDFLMADFDISADDDEVDEFGDDGNNDEFAERVEKDEFSESSVMQDALLEDLIEPDEIDDEIPEIVPRSVETDTLSRAVQPVSTPPPPPPEPVQTNESSLTDSSSAILEDLQPRIDEFNAQVAQLWGEIYVFGQQLEELRDKASDAEHLGQKIEPVVNDVELLQTEQRKLRKAIRESDDRVPTLTYVALGIGIVALLVGGGLGIVGFLAKSEAAKLHNLLATLEEEIAILNQKDHSDEFKTLQMQMEQLQDKDKLIVQEIKQLQSEQDQGEWQSKVQELTEQNQQAQEALTALEKKIEKLESQKRPVSTAKTQRAKTPVVKKEEWVVNLVSFKQEWYARRKAQEFEKQGVQVEIIPVVIDRQEWYRLRARGFKSQSAATEYAVKVKKTLNLSSVWVTREK